MTHNRDHIVISSMKAAVTFSEEAAPGKVLVWHIAAALFVLGVVASTLVRALV